MDSRVLTEVTSATLRAVAEESEGPHRVVWALGSLEQHGPHLPLSADTEIAQAVSEAIRTELNSSAPESATWWSLPPLGLGASGEHEGFVGTVSIGTEALVQVVLEVGRSVSKWAHRLVIVTGHGGNAEALTRAVSTLRAEDRDVCWLECRPAGDPTQHDAHAGRTETSVLLHLRPDLVGSGPYPLGNTEPLENLLPRLRAHGMKAVSANGVLGDARGASAEEGAALLEDMIADALDRIARYEVGNDGRLQPGSAQA